MGTREAAVSFRPTRPMAEVVADMEATVVALFGKPVRRLEGYVPGQESNVYIEIRGETVFVYADQLAWPIVNEGKGDIRRLYEVFGRPPLIVAHIYNDSSYYYGYALIENGVKTRRWIYRGSWRGPLLRRLRRDGWRNSGELTREGTPKDYEAEITRGMPRWGWQIRLGRWWRKEAADRDSRDTVSTTLLRTVMMRYLGACPWWDWQKPDQDFRFKFADKEPAKSSPSSQSDSLNLTLSPRHRSILVRRAW